MYAVGQEHPYKSRSLALLRRVVEGEVEAALDAEVLQEILHRYRALQRWREGGETYDLARKVFLRIFPVTVEVLDRARALLDEYPELMARDALHAAVVQWHGLEAICSFDSDFDPIQGLRRIEPAEEVQVL